MQVPVPPPGSIVWLRQRRWRVDRARADRNVVRFDVSHRDRHLIVMAPFDRPVVASGRRRPRHVRAGRALARLARLVAESGGVRTPMTGLGADIALLPHQFDPVLAMLRGMRRVLVADEAGLGKTIQAGLVLAEVLARESSPRALIVVPAALRTQWTGELQRRFRIETASADRQALEARTRSGSRGESPWMQARVWIGSLDFLKQPHVRESLPLRPWDLVVLDEAHDACGDSDRHDACAEIMRRARRVLLLSATPHAGDERRFARLLHLGVVPGLDDRLVVFRRTRASLGWPATRRICWKPVRLSDAENRTLDTLMAYERRVLSAAGPARRDAALLLLSVLRKRALSTAAALDRSLRRRLDWLAAVGTGVTPAWVQARLLFDGESDSDDVAEDERAGLCAEVGLNPRHERTWLRRLRTIAQQAIPHDSKVNRLVRLLSRTTEPAVLFTEFRDSLEHLQARLGQHRLVATAHGGQSVAERARELERFLEGPASLLIATDVAGQGLNLHGRSRWVVSLELPWNPARLAQRIGRVDRIGQRRRVHATLLVAQHEAEAGLLRHFAQRVLTARRALGTGALDHTMPPGPLAMAAMLLAGQPETPQVPGPDAPEIASLPSRGRAVVRLLARKRRLARHWRGLTDPGGPWQATLRRPLPADLAGARPAQILLVYRTPIVDRAGAILEPHVIVVAAACPASADFAAPAFLAHVTEIARERLRARLGRLRRLLQDSEAHRRAREHALEQHRRTIARHADGQLGLFSPRGWSDTRATPPPGEACTDDLDWRAAGGLDLSVATAMLEAVLRLPPR